MPVPAFWEELFLSIFDLKISFLGHDNPESLGQRGEAQIAGKLGWINFWGRKGKMLRNVYLPSDTTGTTEIDLLYITQKGIFVIESKNYSGYIFGDEEQLKWTASLYAGKDYLGRAKTEKHQFYNPIRQNKNHIKYLTQYLGENVRMISVIVFSERCELKSVNYTSPNICVCQLEDLPELFRFSWDNFSDVLTTEQIEKYYNKLLPLTNVETATKISHIQNVQDRFNDPRKCPLCGAPLVGRTTKSGPHAGRRFWGCSNYPQCRFMKKM